MRPKLYISILAVFVITAIFLLSPEVLLYTLLDDPYLPLGTIITWVGFISFTSLFYYWMKTLRKSTKASYKFIRSSLMSFRSIAFMWLFIAYFFSNNWSSSFSGSVSGFRGSAAASPYYWAVNYFLIAAPLLVFLIFIILRFFKKA